MGTDTIVSSCRIRKPMAAAGPPPGKQPTYVSIRGRRRKVPKIEKAQMVAIVKSVPPTTATRNVARSLANENCNGVRECSGSCAAAGGPA
jgi:hypothetical protein